MGGGGTVRKAVVCVTCATSDVWSVGSLLSCLFGSPTHAGSYVGKMVAAAAAKNLTPTVLEVVVAQAMQCE